MKRSRSDVHARQGRILKYLQENPTTKTSELAEHFSVSISTMRRDLIELSANGEITKVYGGTSTPVRAMSKALPLFDLDRYSNANIDVKEAIAMRAAAMISPGDSVFINSSSTALLIYPHVKCEGVVFITNNVFALDAERNADSSLIILGGEAYMDRSSKKRHSLYGNIAEENIKKISAKVCIIGVSGISASDGLTSQSFREPGVNRAMVDRCTGPVIVVADHRKVGFAHNYNFASISQVDYLITDSLTDPEELQKIRNAGVEVILVDPVDSSNNGL